MSSQQRLPRDYNIIIGKYETGFHNAITDVPGLTVGQVTRIEGDSIRTGVTAILPHQENIFQQKIPAAMYVANGFGKLVGYTQVQELGNIETPIILTNTLSVPTAMNAVIQYTLGLPGNESIRSVNAVVGETNDGYLNDIRGQHITTEDVIKAIEVASIGRVQQGNVGAGTGTRCFGFKGGIGTASRTAPKSRGEYIIGVLVQTNFGGNLRINGTEVGHELGTDYFHNISDEYEDDGSCMIIVATNAPLDHRQLNRLAKRAIFGIARTGGIASHGSGDYVIAFSTDPAVRIPYEQTKSQLESVILPDSKLTLLFDMAIDATEEAILNSLFAAETMQGHNGTAEKLPVEKCLDIIRK